MNNRHPNKRKRPNDGIAITEFALVAVFLTMVTLLTIDFGRIFFSAITLANAAATGAPHAIWHEANATDYAGMEAAALNDAADLSGVTAEAEHYCKCPDGTPDPTCTVTDCGGGYGEPMIYAQVTTQKTFEAVFVPAYLYPGGITVRRTAIIRVR